MSKAKKVRKAATSRLGSSVDEFLREEGLYEENQARAIKEVVAWKLAETASAVRSHRPSRTSGSIHSTKRSG